VEAREKEKGNKGGGGRGTAPSEGLYAGRVARGLPPPSPPSPTLPFFPHLARP